MDSDPIENTLQSVSTENRSLKHLRLHDFPHGYRNRRDRNAAEVDLYLFTDSHSSFQNEVLLVLKAYGVALRELDDDTTSLSQAVKGSPPLLLSLSCETDGGLDHHRRVERIASRYACAWMPAAIIQSKFLFVGTPISIASKPCYMCIWTHVRSSISSDGAASHNMFATLDVAEAAFAAGVIGDSVGEYVESLRRAPDARGNQTVLLYNLQELSSTNLLVGRIPGCRICWPSRVVEPPNVQMRISLPALFEECSRNRTTGSTGEDAGLRKSLTRNPLAAHPRIYPNSPKVSLPAWQDLYKKRTVLSDGKFRLREVAELLFLTFGRWNGPMAKCPDRVLASAGNLGSPEAFILARNVEGIQPGMYSYLEANHTLARVESTCLKSMTKIFAALCENSISQVPDALIMLVGNYGRVSVKYGAFAYRLIHFDSGLFLVHLRRAALSLSLNINEMQSWSYSVLKEALPIDENQSPLMAVIGLSAQAPVATPQTRCSPDEGFESCGANNTCTDHLGSSAALARTIHELSKREFAPTWGGPGIQVSSGLPEEEEFEELSYFSKEELWSQLLTRQSVRLYEDLPVAMADMTTILQRVRSSALLEATVPLVKVLATLRTGYDADPIWRTYELSKDYDGVVRYLGTEVFGRLDSLFVDTPAARAPLLFWLCGDMRLDSWQYRRMLLETGRHAYILIQEASYLGLQGHLVGGIWPKRAASVLGIKFCDESPLLAFACGSPQRSHHGD